MNLENRRAWVHERQGRGFPVLVADQGSGAAGYGTFGEFHPRDGYRLTVEHSIYVAEDARGRGLGKALLAALIEEARRLDKRVMIGAIDATNELSLGCTANGLRSRRLPRGHQIRGRSISCYSEAL